MATLEKLLDYLETIETELRPEFGKINRNTFYNQQKMLAAFKAERIGTHHFQSSTGYGYHDIGREALERVFARAFAAESALVRQQLVSGTHALSCAILGNLRPTNELLIATGYPYETLTSLLGLKADALITTNQELGLVIKVLPLTTSNEIDCTALSQAVNENTKMVFFQRSCGYSERSSFSLQKLGEAFQVIRNSGIRPIILVDNCYGEFVETSEPLEVGADLIAGSLIKNPGGCLAPSGGYIAGRADLVEKAAERLYAPHIGSAIGPSLLNQQLFFQGFFEAPNRVGEMLKGTVLTARLFEEAGYRVDPQPSGIRTDVIQKIFFNSASDLIDFCRAVQENSPVEAHVVPEPAPLPGYRHKVIMGGGTFISGATSELSVDAPIAPPYIAFLQGGLSYTQIKLSLANIFMTRYFKI